MIKEELSRKIKVLHIIGGMNRAGAETFIMNIFRKVDRTKISFDFLCSIPGDYDYSEEINLLGGNIYRLPLAKNRIDLLLNTRKKIIKFFHKYGLYDIIHIHTQHAFSYEIAKGALIAGNKKVLFHSHSAGLRKGIIYKFFMQKLCKLPIVRLACSNEAGEQMFGNKSGYLIINNGIDTVRFAFLEKIRNEIIEKNNINNKFVIGHVGRFDEPKNHNFLIDIFFEISKVNTQAVLLLIGTGILTEKIRMKVEELHLSNKVFFLGSKENTNEYMQAMDAFLFPSLFEGLGIVLIEAQASGLKCFVSDVVPQLTNITDLNQYISLKQNAGYWAEMILNANYNQDRTEYYKKVKNSGFDIEDTVNVMTKIYLS